MQVVCLSIVLAGAALAAIAMGLSNALEPSVVAYTLSPYAGLLLLLALARLFREPFARSKLALTITPASFIVLIMSGMSYLPLIPGGAKDSLVLLVFLYSKIMLCTVIVVGFLPFAFVACREIFKASRRPQTPA